MTRRTDLGTITPGERAYGYGEGNPPILTDEKHPIVAVWRMDARSLEWLIEELEPRSHDDEAFKALLDLRDEAREYLWNEHGG